jgi:hypothetical protein
MINSVLILNFGAFGSNTPMTDEECHGFQANPLRIDKLYYDAQTGRIQLKAGTVISLKSTLFFS